MLAGCECWVGILTIHKDTPQVSKVVSGSMQPCCNCILSDSHFSKSSLFTDLWPYTQHLPTNHELAFL